MISGLRYGVKKVIPLVFSLVQSSSWTNWSEYFCRTEATTTRLMARAYRYPRHFRGPMPKRKNEPGSCLIPLANRSGSKSWGSFHVCSEKFNEWVSTQTGVCREEKSRKQWKRLLQGGIPLHPPFFPPLSFPLNTPPPASRSFSLGFLEPIASTKFREGLRKAWSKPILGKVRTITTICQILYRCGLSSLVLCSLSFDNTILTAETLLS